MGSSHCNTKEYRSVPVKLFVFYFKPFIHLEERVLPYTPTSPLSLPHSLGPANQQQRLSFEHLETTQAYRVAITQYFTTAHKAALFLTQAPSLLRLTLSFWCLEWLLYVESVYMYLLHPMQPICTEHPACVPPSPRALLGITARSSAALSQQISPRVNG